MDMDAPKVPVEFNGTEPVLDREIDHATIELLRRWQKEDATTDPDLIRKAEEEVAEFRRAMRENRTNCG